MRLPNKDHPFLRIGEVREIRIVARILDIQIDFDIDKQHANVERLALDLNAEERPHRAAAAVAGEQIAPLELAHSVRRLKGGDHAAIDGAELGQPVPQVHRSRPPLLDRLVENRLQMVLRHVDDEGVAGILGQQIGAHR